MSNATQSNEEHKAQFECFAWWLDRLDDVATYNELFVFFDLCKEDVLTWPSNLRRLFRARCEHVLRGFKEEIALRDAYRATLAMW